MIGHYLLTLTPEAENSILTGRLAPRSYGNDDGGRCLVGWAADCTERDGDNGKRPQFLENNEWPRNAVGAFGRSVEYDYDDLCDRFGEQRVNAAIRNRILANQARRALRQPVEAQAAVG